MRYITLKFSIIVLLLCCIVFAGVAFTASRRNAAGLSQETSSVPYWTSRIKKVGGVRAYSELSTSVSSADPSVQHGAAHAFGGALFAVEGLPGISVCDDQFSYGCYHEFIGQALLADGLSILPSIRAACDATKAPIACGHGIGHGLLAYFGYAKTDLQKAIDTCTQIGDMSQQGCFGGAFMEYNMRIMTGLKNTRPLDDSLYAPCDTYSGDAKRSCMFYQPQWWWSVLAENASSDRTSLLIHMSSLCAQSDEKDMCFEGVGLMIPASVSYDPKRAIALCKQVTNTQNDQTHCSSAAALVFFGTSPGPQAEMVCASLTGVRNKFCLQYANGPVDQRLPTLPI